jgi:hypothetical protein
MKDEPDCGEDEIVERVQELWDEVRPSRSCIVLRVLLGNTLTWVSTVNAQARERETESQSSLTLEQHEGSRLTLLQDYDRKPTHLISTQPQPQQPESKKEKRKKKKKKSKKAKRLAASEAAHDGAHDFQGSEAVRPGGHQFWNDED